jgi:hypothetical protein
MSLPSELDAEFLAWLGYSPVTVIERPPETETEYPVPDEKVVKGIYVKGWKMTAKPVSAIAEASKRKSDDEKVVTARAQVKKEKIVKDLLAMSPDEIDQYMDANVTDITSAKDMIKTLAKLVLPIALREFR